MSQPVKDRAVNINTYSVRFYEKGQFIGSLSWQFCIKTIKEKQSYSTEEFTIHKESITNFARKAGKTRS